MYMCNNNISGSESKPSPSQAIRMKIQLLQVVDIMNGKCFDRSPVAIMSVPFKFLLPYLAAWYISPCRAAFRLPQSSQIGFISFLVWFP